MVHTRDTAGSVCAYDDFHQLDIHIFSAAGKTLDGGAGGVIQAEDEAEIRELLPTIEISRVAGAGHDPVDDFHGFFNAFGTFLALTDSETQP